MARAYDSPFPGPGGALARREGGCHEDRREADVRFAVVARPPPAGEGGARRA